MKQITPKQYQVLEMVRDFITEYGIPPTRMEIANDLGFKSPNAAEEHLRALQRKGVIELLAGSSRGIRLKDSLREQIGLPLVGRVAAGNPILAEENRVQGMSMKDIGIYDNDLVAVHRTSEIRSRQVVVARVDNEVTVKRYSQTGSTVWLHPENGDFSPIEIDLATQEMVIEGIVVGVIRPDISYH